eukprot:PhM_4_TR8586/c0_g1_i1/m.67796
MLPGAIWMSAVDMCKVSVAGGAGAGLVDVAMQAYEQGVCWCSPKRDTKSRSFSEFEVDMMRALRNGTVGLVAAPIISAVSQISGFPNMILQTLGGVIVAEVVAIPTMWAMHNFEEELTLENLRPYVVPILITSTLSTYAIAYSCSVALEHVKWMLPLTSAMTVYAPEGIIVPFGFSIAGAMYAVLVNIVSKQRLHHDKPDVNSWLSTRTAVACGYLSTAGLALSAVIPTTHIGATMFFATSIPFLLMLAKVGPNEQHQMFRKMAYGAFAVATVTYPLLVHGYPHVAAISEGIAGLSFMGLLFDGRFVVSEGPEVQEIYE